jgi:hypothetical protein
MTKQWLTTAEAVQVLGCQPQNLYEMRNRGEIKFTVENGEARWDIREYLARQAGSP